GERDRDLALEVRPFAPEELVVADGNIDVQIARGSAVARGLTLARHAHPGGVFDSRGDLDGNLPLHALGAAAPASRAGVGDPLPLPAARRTGALDAEKAGALHDDAASAAALAGLGRLARLR